MSTLEDRRGAGSPEAQRQARYDTHLEEKRAVGARARAEARLQAAFEADLLSVHALESRLMAVNKARTVAEIDAVLADVPLLDEPLLEQPLEASAGASAGALAGTQAGAQTQLPAHATPTAIAAEVPRSGWTLALLGGTVRKGRWRVPRRLRVVATLGGCELDFTSAELGAETDITCVAVMGGVEIKVPPGVRVEGNGVGILGGFEQGHRGGADPGAPVLRIGGLALMGGVEVRTVEADGG